MILYPSTSSLNFARIFLSPKSVKALKGRTTFGGDMNPAWLLEWLHSSPKYYSLPHFDALCDMPRKVSGRLAIIETSSMPAYEKTRHFHLNHGYEVICRITDFYAPGDDKLMLQKSG
jgi:hypothetical protein